MKLTLQIILGATVVMALSLPTLAQNASNPDANKQNHAAVFNANTLPLETLRDAAKASSIIGMTVKNDRDRKLGKVAEIAVDVESGRIVEVILSSGGFPGINSAFTPVPPQLFRLEAGRKILRLDASMATINNAPRFFPASWNQCTQSNWVTQVYAYYSVHPYFVAEHGKYRTNSVDGIFASSLPRHMDGTINTAGGHTVTTLHNEEIASALLEPINPVPAEYPEGTWTTNQLTHKDGSVSEWSTLVYVQKLGKLMGKPVNNLQGQKLGMVQNFLLDLPAGKIVAIIISSDETPAAVNGLSAVSPAELRYNTEYHTLQLDSSVARLASYPHFTADKLADFQPVRLEHIN
jgi:sporulation protein YlmC with PRC-barrel domain